MRLVILMACALMACACGRIGFDVDATQVDASTVDASTVDATPDAPQVRDVWIPTTPLPLPRAFTCAVLWAGWIYVIGGGPDTGPSLDVVIASPILPDGMLGSWTQVSTLPIANEWHACGVDPTSASLYVIGGNAGTTARTNVYRSTLASGGSVGSWSTELALPSPRRGHRVIVDGGYVYVIGGETGDGTLVQDTIYVSQIGAGGTLGAWGTTTTLPAADYEMGAAIANGTLYLSGGHAGDNLVRVASIGGGAVGAFGTTMPLPAIRERHGSIAHDGFVYVFGGRVSFSAASETTVFRAPILANNMLGTWTLYTALPVAASYPAIVSYAGRIYALGGRVVSGVSTDAVSVIVP